MPLSIVLDVQRDCPGNTLHASINSAGDAEVISAYDVSPNKNSARLDPATQARLRRLVSDGGFFTLPSTIGRPTPDGTEVVLTVALGNYSHTVTVYANSLAGSIDTKEADRFRSLYRGIADSISDYVSDVELLKLP